MNTRKPAVHNTAYLESPRSWPLKADHLDLPRKKALAFIEKFNIGFGLECLRERGNFRHMSFIEPNLFDPVDLHQALEIIIDTVNAQFEENREARALKNHLERFFGPLTGCIAVRLDGWPLVIQTKIALQ